MAKPRKPMQATLDLLNRAGEGGDPSLGSDQKPEVTLEQVQKELAELRAVNDRLSKESESAQSNLMAALTTPTYSKPEPKPTGIDMANLPNPAEDGPGYAAELAKRFQTAYENQKHNENLQAAAYQDTRTQQEVLWEDFKESYSDYAQDPTKISIAAEQVTKVAQRKKIPLDKYMFGNSKQFMKDTAQMYDKLFGKPNTAGSDDNDDDGEDDTRTQGIFGGNESGGKAAPSGKQKENTGSFTQSIREWQVKNGYYR